MYDKGVYNDKNYLYSELEKDSNLIGSMFVCQIKRNKKTGQIEKYKVRLVALGNQQKRRSYEDIKSSNARLESVKLMMALKTKLGARHFTIDVKVAYLNAENRRCGCFAWRKKNNKKVLVGKLRLPPI